MEALAGMTERSQLMAVEAGPVRIGEELTSMTVHLRGHHLLCVLTYVGKGYSEDFVANLDRLVERVAMGEDVRIVDGPDDICAPLLSAGQAPAKPLSKQPHCHMPRIRERDARAMASVAELIDRPVAPGEYLSFDRKLVERLRKSFAAGTLRGACAGCEWSGLCTDITDDRYRAVRLHPPR